MNPTIYRTERGTDLDRDKLTNALIVAIEARPAVDDPTSRRQLDREITNGIAALLARYHVAGPDRAATITSYRTLTVRLIATSPEEGHAIIQTAAARAMRYRDAYYAARKDWRDAGIAHVETMRHALQTEHDRTPFRWDLLDDVIRLARLDAYTGQLPELRNQADSDPPGVRSALPAPVRNLPANWTHEPKPIACLDMPVRIARDHMTTRADQRRLFLVIPNGAELLIGSICSTVADPTLYRAWLASQRVNARWCEIQADPSEPLTFDAALAYVVARYTAWRERSGLALDEWGQYRQEPGAVAA